MNRQKPVEPMKLYGLATILWLIVLMLMFGSLNIFGQTSQTVIYSELNTDSPADSIESVKMKNDTVKTSVLEAKNPGIGIEVLAPMEIPSIVGDRLVIRDSIQSPNIFGNLVRVTDVVTDNAYVDDMFAKELTVTEEDAGKIVISVSQIQLTHKDGGDFIPIITMYNDGGAGAIDLTDASNGGIATSLYPGTVATQEIFTNRLGATDNNLPIRSTTDIVFDAGKSIKVKNPYTEAVRVTIDSTMIEAPKVIADTLFGDFLKVFDDDFNVAINPEGVEATNGAFTIQDEFRNQMMVAYSNGHSGVLGLYSGINSSTGLLMTPYSINLKEAYSSKGARIEYSTSNPFRLIYKDWTAGTDSMLASIDTSGVLKVQDIQLQYSEQVATNGYYRLGKDYTETWSIDDTTKTLILTYVPLWLDKEVNEISSVKVYVNGLRQAENVHYQIADSGGSVYNAIRFTDNVYDGDIVIIDYKY